MPASEQTRTDMVITLELNELDFELLAKYVAEGQLPNFRRLFDRHDVVPTIAEQEYAHLEPWIQWVTAHTGLTYSEHGVFRLGDMASEGTPQIWDVLEQRYGLRVGAISPMNARNNLKNAAFFVPDPWTRTPFSGSWDLKLLNEAIAQVVNDNAHEKITLGSYARLALGASANFSLTNLPEYVRFAVSGRHHKWRKALLLDLLLSDAFIRHCARAKPNYASLFLNAGAHIQHHYMASSRHYGGSLTNPAWYLPPGMDPVAEVYALYDRILGKIMSSLANVRLLVCTGLSQKPNDVLVHYYRPKHHDELLRMLGVKDFEHVLPRMSRDFLIVFSTNEAARAAQRVVESFESPQGEPIFSVDNRGSSLFCMLSYTGELSESFEIRGNARTIPRLAAHISLVSIENAIHKTIGYFVDTGLPKSGATSPIPLTDVFDRTLAIWGAPRAGRDVLPAHRAIT